MEFEFTLTDILTNVCMSRLLMICDIQHRQTNVVIQSHCVVMPLYFQCLEYNPQERMLTYLMQHRGFGVYVSKECKFNNGGVMSSGNKLTLTAADIVVIVLCHTLLAGW